MVGSSGPGIKNRANAPVDNSIQGQTFHPADRTEQETLEHIRNHQPTVDQRVKELKTLPQLVVGKPSSDTIQFLTNMLQSADYSQERIAAAEVLGLLGDKSCLQSLKIARDPTYEAFDKVRDAADKAYNAIARRGTPENN